MRFSGFGERDFVCTHRKQLLFLSSLIVTVQPANHSAKMQMRHDTGKEVQHEANLQQQTLDLLHSPANSKLYYNL